MVVEQSVEVNADAVRENLDEMIAWVAQAAADSQAEHVVERTLLDFVLRLGGQLLSAFLNSVGEGDLGEELVLEDGRTLQRHEALHTRVLRTVFGEFSLSRCVYSAGNKQAIALAPTDQRLELPEGQVSYLLQEWDQLFGIEQAFGKVRDAIEMILGIRQSVDTLEHGSRQMAQAAEAFFAQQPPADPQQEGELLVATEDNKGIPMVRPASDPAAVGHRTKGQKKNKKQMACVGCVYSVDRHLRTGEELVKTLFRDDERSGEQPPPPQFKRYRASLTREVDGVEVRGQSEVFAFLQREVAGRRREGQTLIHLCDGQASLETDRQAWLPSDEHTVDILDLMHALPRVWEAAHVFEREGSPQASAFVRVRLQKMLAGRCKSVIAELRGRGTRMKLSGPKRKKLDQLTGFLENNLHRMKYDQYLAAGYPIATGVIEGACRHLVKDRMERSGMRWKVPGAQAMLTLRSLHASGDWQTFQTFRIQHETKRLYPHNLNTIKTTIAP